MHDQSHIAVPSKARDKDALPAVDCGTPTGWVLRGPDGLITSGTACFRPGRFDGGGMRDLRLDPRVDRDQPVVGAKCRALV